MARERWNHYSGSRRILLEKLTFVREDEENCWVDLASGSARPPPGFKISFAIISRNSLPVTAPSYSRRASVL